MDKNRGFTLVETLIYSAIFVVVSTLLVSLLGIVTRLSGQENAAAEVASQASFILQNIERLVTSSSLVEVCDSGTVPPCAVSTLKIYPKDFNVTPTTVALSGSDVVVTDGSGPSPLNTSKVVVNSLAFTKFSNPGGFDNVAIDLTLSYNSSNPAQSLTRALHTAVSRANAAQFDTGLFPTTAGIGVGAVGTRWAGGFFVNGDFSGDLTVGGNIIANGANSQIGVGVANVTAGTKLEVGSGGYFQFDKSSAGAPPAGDCSAASQKGRMILDTTNNRLYICTGAAWKYAVLN